MVPLRETIVCMPRSLSVNLLLGLIYHFTFTGNGSASDLIFVNDTSATMKLIASASGTVTATIPADKIFDPAGNGNEAISFTWTYDGTAPSVSSVTALVADGSYIEGQQIPIALIFTENVVVTDTPFYR